MAEKTAKAKIDIMTRHTYFPTLIIADKESVFLLQVIHEVAKTLDNNLNNSTPNPTETIEVLERANATIKNFLKMASGNTGKKGTSVCPLQT